MNKLKVGYRVGAIQKADKETVYMYGFGTYVGDEVSPEFPVPNPKIQLDNGEVVWGYQCWWGPEEKVNEMIAGRKIEFVSMSD